MAEMGLASLAPPMGATGCLAIWQCTHSIGSEAAKAQVPVSIWKKVMPSE